MTRALLLGTVLLLGCDEADEPTMVGSDGTTACDTEPALTWENFGQGHLDQHCNGCHGTQLRPDQRNGAPVGVDFDTYSLTLPFAERIRVRTLESGDMPPLGGPTPEELATFAEWIECELIPDATPEEM